MRSIVASGILALSFALRSVELGVAQIVAGSLVELAVLGAGSWRGGWAGEWRIVGAHRFGVVQ